jgi:tryptophan-rich sensory protein
VNNEGCDMKDLRHYDVDTVSALFAGVFCAAIFNPFDRAMFLASCHQSPVFLWVNFTTLITIKIKRSANFLQI